MSNHAQTITLTPNINILRTFTNKMYKDYRAAFDEYVSNAIDSIIRDYQQNPDSTKKYKIITARKGDDLIIIDNGSGCVGEDILKVTQLGASGTRELGISGSHGTYGAGCTSAAFYLAGQGNVCTLTAVSFVGEDRAYSKFDPKMMEESNEPWQYLYSVDPGQSPDFLEKLSFLEEILPEDSASGIAIFIENGCNKFPKKISEAWKNISKNLQANYAYKFLQMSQMGIDVEFVFLNNNKRAEKACFRISDAPQDNLDYKPAPEEINWFIGGPNYEYEYKTFFGLKLGFRMSWFEKYSSRDRDDAWGSGYYAHSCQGTGWIRNGKRVTCSTDKAWSFDGTKRGTLVEITWVCDADNPDLSINQEKTDINMSDRLSKEIVEFLNENVQKIRNKRGNKIDESKKTEEMKNLQRAAAKVISTPRKWSAVHPEKRGTIPDNTISKSIQDSHKKSIRASYIGKSSKAVTSRDTTKDRSGIEIDFKELIWAKEAPFWLEDTDAPGTRKVTINKSNQMVKHALDKGADIFIATMACSTMFSSLEAGKTLEEIHSDITKISELFTLLSAQMKENEKRSLSKKASLPQ